MKNLRYIYLTLLALLLATHPLWAQQIPTPSADTLITAPVAPTDTTRSFSPPPTRPDTTQFNSADRPDTVRTTTQPTVPQPIPTTAAPAPAAPSRSAGISTGDNAPRIGKITGRLVATQNGRSLPVEFASVGLFRISDSTSAGGALTDEKGFFQLQNLPPGNFYVIIQSLGYAPKKLPRVSISPQSPELELGNVSMTETVRQLQEVVVQGQKQLMDYSLDRKIVNIDQLPVALGGSASDILSNVPSVTVDVDGTLSLRGSSNVIVLIDGKPSGLTGLDRQAVLEQIPASNIERIELITNPSSRFDADGTAGIINIVLKKERAQGFNGTAQFNAGTRDKYNTSLNLNYRVNKVNLFGSYNFRHDRRFNYRDSERQNLFGDSTSYLVQRNDGFRIGNNHNARLGIDYSLTPRDNLTASVLLQRDRDRSPSTEIINTLDDNRTLLGRIIRTAEETEPERGVDYTFGYRRKFPKQGRELTFDATLSTERGTEFTDYSLTAQLPENLLTPNLRVGQQRSTNAEQNKVGVLQLDFVEPMKDKKRFETGLKFTYRLQDADYVFEDQLNGAFVRNTNISNNFVYDERTSAAYVNFGNEFRKISYQLGLRTEYTTITTDQRTTAQRNTRDYLYLFPSAFLNYNISQAQKMQVNYSRRINRPWVRALNPFIDLTDPLNISFGNPNLNPELINSFELSHLWYGKSTSLTSSLFFRQTNNSITRYRTLRPDGVTEQTSLNLNRAQNYGLEIVLSQEILKWWKVNGNFTFFQANIQPGPGVPEALSRTNQSWTARVNSTLSPWKGTDMQLAVNYRSPFIVAQGTIQGFFNIDFGLKQDVLKGRGSLNFRISDIFNTLQFRSETFGTNFTATSRNKRESRIAFIGFSYRLSKQVFRDRERNRDRESEGDRDDEF